MDSIEELPKERTTSMHFRVDTMALFQEIVDNALIANHGILKVPLNTLRVLLAQVAERCTELHDPVLDRLMFDLALYELPKPTTPEYGALMKQVYATEKKFLKALEDGSK